MTQRNFASRVLGIALAIMAVCVSVSCTNELKTANTRSENIVSSDDEHYANNKFTINCNQTDWYSIHTGESLIEIWRKKADAPEKSFQKTLKSGCTLRAEKDTVWTSEDAPAPEQSSVSINNSFKNNKETDVHVFTISDGQILYLSFEAEHGDAETWMGTEYPHGHDSLLSVKVLKPERVENMTRAASQYVKDLYITKYPVVTETQAYTGDGMKSGTVDVDTLFVTAVTKELADNNTTDTKTGAGEKIINETQQKDSVIITKTWSDGHSERMVFNTILNRSIKNIERRVVFVNDFDEKSFASSFSRVEKEEKVVRKDGNWIIYGREIVISKMISVNGHVEEITYTLYQERAEFSYKDLFHSFGYVNWTVNNYADDFKPSMVSSMSGYDELNYRNEIRTDYLGYVQFVDETIAWFKKAVEFVHYDYINTKRVDYTTFTFVSLDRVAVYSDGSTKEAGTYSVKIPIVAAPLSNWVINDKVWGVYTSDDLNGTLMSKTAEEADKFFSYNRYTYRYTNNVAGQVNAMSVSVPNDIVFRDGKDEYTFTNSDLKVEKSGENTKLGTDDAEKTSYAYACVASVTFGDASQDVTMPGTINIMKQHDHGKVVATYMTSTPNEDRSYWKNVAVIAFEDGYRMIGLADNNDMSFDFSMTSYNDVNSAVYANGQWIPSKAEDSETSRCMIWRDENNAPKRTLDFITATRNAWNNGHNTVSDIRREGKISDGGYTVTFYLNGIAGQKLSF